jgi:hypothetical protein
MVVIVINEAKYQSRLMCIWYSRAYIIIKKLIELIFVGKGPIFTSNLCLRLVLSHGFDGGFNFDHLMVLMVVLTFLFTI